MFEIAKKNIKSNALWIKYVIKVIFADQQIGESDVQYTTGWVSHKAEYRNMFMVTVDLHEPRSKRSATEQPSKPEGYDISLSYDGQNYGEHVAVIVYDDECYSCNSSFVCISSVG